MCVNVIVNINLYRLYLYLVYLVYLFVYFIFYSAVFNFKFDVM